MAGHSKWANIQHRKGAQDKKRGKIFTKLIKEITVSARIGGADANSNPRLRLAIDKALGQNMPKDNIERAIKRGTGDMEGVNYEEIRYEGYGPGGVAVMVDCMTDNRNRTVGEVRHAFSKHGGNLGTDGSVAYMFSKMGILSFAPGVNEEQIIEIALESGAEDVISQDDGSMEVLTTEEQFINVKQALIDAGVPPDDDEVSFRAATDTELDVDTGKKMLALQEMLEDLDDVQSVYTNADMPAEVFED